MSQAPTLSEPMAQLLLERKVAPPPPPPASLPKTATKAAA